MILNDLLSEVADQEQLALESVQEMRSEPTCIIGAGAAGIAAAKAISSAGLRFDWFEAGSQFGGIWRYGNDTGSSVYASLRTNTSQKNMEWFGYPMPKRANDYLKHEQVLEYLTNFVAHAQLEDKISLATHVISVEPLREGGFRVALRSRSGECFSRRYGAVVVAVGCHSTPKWPKIPGVLDGRLMHASEYRSPEVFAGKRVVVAGFGASGADIVCDAADVASSVILSTRRGGYLLPRYLGATPRDENDRPWLALAPLAFRRQIWRLTLLQRSTSPKVKVALERHASPYAKPAVINDRLAELIDSDRVIVKSHVERFDGDRVIFSDGASAGCDVFVCATGYDLVYPFFSPELTGQNACFGDRYLRVIPPNQRGLYFVGRISVVGPFFPIFERQAAWVADLLSRQCILPSRFEMRRCARRETSASSLIFPDSGRRADIVEYYPYLRALERAHAASRTRASKRTASVGPERFAVECAS